MFPRLAKPRPLRTSPIAREAAFVARWPDSSQPPAPPARPALLIGFPREDLPMRIRDLTLAAFAFLSLTAAAPPEPRASLLVSTGWLAGHLRDVNLVVLQVGP